MLRKINLGLKRFFDILISFACIIILFIIPVFEIVFIVINVEFVLKDMIIIVIVLIFV